MSFLLKFLIKKNKILVYQSRIRYIYKMLKNKQSVE